MWGFEVKWSEIEFIEKEKAKKFTAKVIKILIEKGCCILKIKMFCSPGSMYYSVWVYRYYEKFTPLEYAHTILTRGFRRFLTAPQIN